VSNSASVELTSQAIAYYATMSTAAATVLGLGAALLASRAVALAERASNLGIERGDLINSTGDEPARSWNIKHRTDSLASLHELVQQTRRTVAWQLVETAVIVALCAAPLAGLLDDTVWLRWVVAAGFLTATGLWIRAIHVLFGDVERATRVDYLDRERRRAAATAAGEPYIVSGDPKTLTNNLNRLSDEMVEAIKNDDALSRRQKWRALWKVRRGRKRNGQQRTQV